MFSRIGSIPPENPNLSDQPASTSNGSRRFGRKLFVITAAVIVVVAVAVALMIPQGVASIPLTVN